MLKEHGNREVFCLFTEKNISNREISNGYAKENHVWQFAIQILKPNLEN